MSCHRAVTWRYPYGLTYVKLTWALLLLLGALGHTQVTLDGSVGPAGSLPGPDVIVPAEVGRTHGANLFHSFGQFNVPDQGSVTFTGPTSVANILGRVTGGSPSRIDGSLRSEIPGANLYLINPAGVVFGLYAQLDVQGSVHISTADTLQLTDRARFSADLSETSVLSTAPPAAFGFIRAHPAPIAINGSQLRTLDSTGLSIVGGDIHIRGDTTRFSITPTASTQGGPLTLVSVASPGNVVRDTTDAQLYTGVDDVERLGTIMISDGARLRTIGPSGGTIIMRGQQIVIDDSVITSQSDREVDGAPIGIDMQASGDIVIRNDSHVQTTPSIAGSAGALRIRAGGAILVTNQGERDAPSSISSFANAGLDAGDIVITAGRSITIEGQIVDLLSSRISSQATNGGQSGDITLTAPILHIDGGLLSTGRDLVVFPVSAGRIAVSAQTVTLVNGGRIDSSHTVMQQGGAITITAEASITIAGTSAAGRPSGIRSQSFSPGRAGDITLTTPTLNLEGGEISTVAFGSGQASTIRIHAQRLAVSGGGTITIVVCK